MSETKLGVVEGRFADLIWQREPVTTRELVELAQQELSWKKSTTYTILKRLCQRGLFENDGGTVHALMSREDFYAMQSEKFVQETFDGSLPAFVAAFTARKKLSQKEIDQLEALIASMRG